MSESDRQQIQDYMAKHGINELLYELLEGICLDMPDNPHQFIVDYMQEHFPDKVRVAGGGAPPISIDEEDEEDGEEEEEEEDQMGATPASFRQSEMSDSFRKRVPNHARRRTGVSAEVMSPGILRREGYTPVVHEKPAEVRTALQDILGENILFKDLDAAQMTTLLDAMFEATFSAGEVIIEQGAEGDNFYVVFKGECEVFVAKSEGQEAEQVHSYGVGGAFGELALMYNAPRAATVKAATDATLFAVDRTTFKLILMDSALRRRDRHAGFLSHVRVLSTLTEYERATIADALEPQLFEAGAVIITQGEQGDAFYIIEEGEVTCTQHAAQDKPPKEIGRCQAGDYFGEIALLTNRSRACTVTAVGPVKVLTLQRKTFNRVMGPLRDLLKRNMEAYNSYMLM